jgi:glucose/arabinose dehydrogenase
MSGRRWSRLVARGGLLAAIVVLACCSYIALPGGWTINFPGFSGEPLAESELQRRVQLPDGFTIETYAEGIDNARMLRVTSTGDVLVSSPREGKVFLLERDRNADSRADSVRVLLDGLESPHGLALDSGWLYVAETDAVLRVKFDESQGTIGGAPERIIRGLPAGGNHWTKTVGVGPDGKLYVAGGSSCNVCIEDDPRRAAILRYEIDGSGEQIFATGLRNAVGFAWQPGTGALYATDNGRDLLGDDFPPCELNQVVEAGFYGWPIANGDRVPDPDYGNGQSARIAASIPPVHGFGPHTAPLGITFYTGDAFPERYRGAAFVAEHGSWNRSRKIGYQVVAVFFAPDGTISEEPFLTGFMVDEEVAGRPVDVAVAPDGALYVSDDFTGSIYRITYGEAPRARAPGAGTAAQPARADPLAALDAAEIARASARGRKLWEAHGCAACHVAVGGKTAAAGSGETAAAGERVPVETVRLLAGLSRKYSIDSMVAFLRAPQPPMPVAPLSDAERRDLAIYLLATHP